MLRTTTTVSGAPRKQDRVIDGSSRELPENMHLTRLLTPSCTVIKHPMDLGTVLKKVKAQQYKEKKAFKADLDLIWDNCLLYNTLPVSVRSSNMCWQKRTCA